MVRPHFLSEIKGKLAKEMYLASQVAFTIKFFRIFQRTEVIVVNVKHKFPFESR